jgi:hypothetical protein
MAQSCKDRVYTILMMHPVCRDSDRKLFWRYYHDHYGIGTLSIDFTTFMNGKYDSYETISRARRAVQAEHPELSASPIIAEARASIEATKGDFINHTTQTL